MAEGEEFERLSVSTTRTECGICLEDANRLKLLPCYHSFCLQCLQLHMDSNTRADWFRCPLCRKKLAKPETGADGFDDNIYTEASFLLPDGSLVKCQACDDNDADQRCLECKQVYCEGCARLHLKMANSKSHHITNANKEDLKVKVNQRTCCPVHQNKKLGYFCLDCKEVICGKCVIESHKSHSCDEVAEIAKNFRSDLSNLLASPNNGFQFLAMLEGSCAEIKKGRNVFQNDVQNECQKIEIHGQRIKDKIDKAVKNLTTEMVEREKNMMQLFNGRVQDAEGKLKWARGTVQTIAQIMEVSSDAEFVAKFAGINKELVDMKSQIQPSLPVQAEVRFMHVAPSVEDLVKNMGYIEIRGPVRYDFLSKVEFPTASLAPPCIASICPVSESEACIAYGTSLEITDKYGHKRNKIDFDETVIAVAIDNSGNLFVATNSCIHLIRITTVARSSERLLKLETIPSAIAVSREGHVVVCSKDSGNVALISSAGDPILELNEGYLRQPASIAINPEGNMFISDNGTEDITLVDQTGKLLSVIHTPCMTPMALCLDGQGHMIVVDTRSYVHLLTEDGQYLQNVTLPRQRDMVAIRCLALDPTGDLWIGDSKGTVGIFYQCK